MNAMQMAFNGNYHRTPPPPILDATESSKQSKLDRISPVWDFDKMTKQRIQISVPAVFVRKFQQTGCVYLVYQIHVQLSTNSTRPDEQPTSREPTIEWDVYHRYTTLARLHADLTGHSLNENDQAVPDSPDRRLAHECLPRPLPGVGLLRFPQKHLVPSIPKLVRHKDCVRRGQDNRMIYEDFPVCLTKHSRFDERRRKLENYLQNLVTMIWHLTEDCDEVADVYRSMLTPQPDQNKMSQDQLLIPEWSELEQIRKKLLKLLPIFEP